MDSTFLLLNSSWCYHTSQEDRLWVLPDQPYSASDWLALLVAFSKLD